MKLNLKGANDSEGAEEAEQAAGFLKKHEPLKQSELLTAEDFAGIDSLSRGQRYSDPEINRKAC